MPRSSREQEPVFDEIDEVANDLQRKQRRYRASTEKRSSRSILLEDDKVTLALRTSEATHPGAVHQHNEPNMSNDKPSAEQERHMARMRVTQKTRLVEDTPNELRDGGAFDEFQERMRTFQADANNDDEFEALEVEKLKQQARRKRCIVIALVVALVLTLIGAGVGVAIGLGGSNSTATDSATDTTTDPEFDINLCYTQADGSFSERYTQLRSVLMSKRPSIADSTEASGSTARKALCWLADQDELDIQVVEGLEYDVIQRFTLGLIYFHFVDSRQPKTQNDLSASNWLSSTHECDWDFTTCSSNYVVKLSLQTLRLEGSIPTELSMLTALLGLVLSRNELSGTIPQEMFNMSQLKELDLGLNQLSGSLSNHLGDLIQLTYLAIPGNKINGEIPDMPRLNSLLALEISENLLMRGSFPDLSGSTRLEFLNLGNTDLTGTVPSYLWGVTSLGDLILRANRDLGGTISTEIGQMRSLESLDFSDTTLSGEIPTEIGNISRLTRLELEGLRDLSGTIPSELGRLAALETLNLQFSNGLSGTIPFEICDLRDNALTVFTVGCQLNCNCCTKCQSN